MLLGPAAASSSASTSATAHHKSPGPAPRSLLRRKLGQDEQPRLVGTHYQLGVEIGRGAFGVVYTALDLRNARSVAIKEVALREIARDDLASIESEISLLRKLHHEHIVTYVDAIKTQTHLYIVLEYMENGSLAQLMKKFGGFSETLVAMYVRQVLQGLVYLHEQGVLHRDVKGANILTTKDGLVKLADFGVAIKLSDTMKSNSVVGSPYWMAPEVIEMAGWSFAADIWSVGCTIIELLSTKPPYFDLAPMAALFRIVQDDHPPLPERISPALHDFMMKCFMKEPRLRYSAQQLLQHPWIAQIPKRKVEQSTQFIVESVSSAPERTAVLNTIKRYASGTDIKDVDVLSDVPRGEKTSQVSLSKTVAVPTSTSSPPHEESNSNDDDEDWNDEFGIDAAPQPLSLRVVECGGENAQQQQTQSHLESSPPKPQFHLSQEDADVLLDDELWEDEPESSSIQTQHSEYAPDIIVEDKRWNESALLPVDKRLSKLQAFSEDDEDWANAFNADDEQKLLEAAAARIQLQGSVRDSTPANDIEDDGLELHDADLDLTESPLQLHMNLDSVDEPLFDDDMDFEYSSLRESNQNATAHVVELLALLDPSMEDQVILDACTSLQEIFEANPRLPRELNSELGVVPNIMEAMEVKKLDVLHAVLKVMNLIIENNQRFQENMAMVGLVPVVIRLTNLRPSLFSGPDAHHHALTHDFSADVRLEAAKFVRQSCRTSVLTLQMFIACGGLPVLVDFLTVDPLRPLATQKDMLRIALEGIYSVFTLQTIPKNDICRLFVKAGLLPKFIVLFREISRAVLPRDDQMFDEHGFERQCNHRTSTQPQDHPWSMEDLHQICDVFVLFSQGDAVVKEHMCDHTVLEGLLQALGAREATEKDNNPRVVGNGSFVMTTTTPTECPERVQAVVKLLKCIRNLSMEPQTLEKLDRAGAISTLVRLLDEDMDSSREREVENIVLQAIFYLCRLNRTRQTRAAQAGVVPLLVQVVESGSPLKQFALPLLCDFAHASPIARSQLWAFDGLPLFLSLLDDKYWQIDAIKSISAWLIHDTVQLENVLLIPANLLQVVECFTIALDTEIENLLDPLLEIMTRSVRLNQALGRCAMFVTEILVRLERVDKAIVQKSLLKMLKCLFESHTQPTHFVVEYNLYPTVSSLAQGKNSLILVKEIASQLLQAILVAASVC